MRHLQRVRVLAVLGVMSLAGCVSLEDSPFHTKLGMALYELDPLIDSNWPSAQNLGPLQGPQRLRPEPTAIGVNWATGQPPWQQQSPPLEAPSPTATNDPPQAAEEASPDGATELPAPVDVSGRTDTGAAVVVEPR